MAGHILTLLVESHSSYANIQGCLRRLTGVQVSISTIAAVVQEAQHRALQWMSTLAPPTMRAVALDEIYAKQRQGASLRMWWTRIAGQSGRPRGRCPSMPRAGSCCFGWSTTVACAGTQP